MKDWQKAVVSADVSILDALRVINDEALGIALVTDIDGLLIGVATDGDVRRGLLREVTLESSVAEVMNTSPTTVPEGTDAESVLDLMRAKTIHQIPVLDGEGHVVGVEILDNLLEPEPQPNTVVLMAGGLGTRLRPLTEEVPKPLLKVGDRPILETILVTLVGQGFHDFVFCVNYKAEMIVDHFGDGDAWHAHIRYVHEEERLGTAGALSLLPERPSDTVLVMNGDLLTKLDFTGLLEFHRHHDAVGTMCVRDYDYSIPYGVVRTDEHRILAIEEKPVQRHYVNAGIYALEPEALDRVPRGTYLDMPQLFTRLNDEGLFMAVYPIREFWMDVGRMEDYTRADQRFDEVFG